MINITTIILQRLTILFEKLKNKFYFLNKLKFWLLF